MIIEVFYKKKEKKNISPKEEIVRIVKKLSENNSKSSEIFTDKEKEFLKKNLFSLKKQH